MNIRFTKGTGKEKPGTMACLRDDGSRTWVPLAHNFAQHDLAHWVVETTLGLRQSFYSLVAGGVDIPDFALPKEKRKVEIPPEAVQTEHIVGHLQVEMADGALIEDFNASIAASCAVLGQTAPPAIPPATLEILRARIRDLWRRWQEIPPGGVLELEFPLPVR